VDNSGSAGRRENAADGQRGWRLGEKDLIAGVSHRSLVRKFVIVNQ
jgi:hypothetical protein